MKRFGIVLSFVFIKQSIKRVNLYSVSQTLYHPRMLADWEGRLEQEGNDSKLFNKTGFAQIVWA